MVCGVRMANLSSFSEHDPARKNHALYAFCASKLWDALHYTHRSVDTDAWLRGIRLGRPLTDKPGSWGAVAYREYENGLVAVNLYGIAQQANVPWTDKPYDVESHFAQPCLREPLEPEPDGSIVIKLSPDRCALIVPRDR